PSAASKGSIALRTRSPFWCLPVTSPSSIFIPPTQWKRSRRWASGSSSDKTAQLSSNHKQTSRRRGKIMSTHFLSPDSKRASSGMSPSARTAQSLLTAIHNLAPGITKRAAEIEASRRIPAYIVEALKSTGIFRMFVPRNYGGLELDLPAGLEVLGELAKIDGSVGWAAMTSSCGSLFAPYLPQQTYETIYRNGPDVIFAGATQPAGTAQEAGAGA